MSIFKHFKHLNLSQDQSDALGKLEVFLNSPDQVFILKGYAGSGKTTILSGFVNYLNDIKKDFALMAPTGRAVKVLREKTGHDALTIHKTIYSYDDIVEIDKGSSFYYYFKIRNSIDVVNKVFIVDEASLLSDAKNEGEFYRYGTGHLLTDLITYTRIDHPSVNSKIIFVGDPCQLSPVGDDRSKAFDSQYLYEKFNLISHQVEMKEVKRQQGESGILKVANNLRKSITSSFYNNFDLRPNGKDLINTSFSHFLDEWDNCSNPKIIIANKNKTCLNINLQIRKRKFGNSFLPIQKSDKVIMGGNNYRKGVINGEFAVVNSSSEVIEKRDIYLKGKNPVTLVWRDVELIFPDSEYNNKVVSGKMLENFINGDNSLKPDEIQALYVDFTMRHSDLSPKSIEFKEAILNDEYFNCLLIKYGYAVTCHKAQGGEWENVFTIWDHDNTEGFNCFVDKQNRIGKGNQDFYKWAYTAITRATKKLYTLNAPLFNAYSSMAIMDFSVVNAINELTGTQVQTEEVELDSELLKQISEYNLLDQPIAVQDHFIKIRHAVRKHFIEIVRWERLGYEIRFSFLRDQEKAVFRTYTNAQNQFKNSMTPMPNYSLNSEFNKLISELLSVLPNISIRRNTADTIIKQIEFDIELEEKSPFLKNIFDDLTVILQDTKIIIAEIEHMQFKERYTFQKNNEIAVLDFEYNNNGVFGRVIPIQKSTNSVALLSTIQAMLQILKIEENAR